MDTYIFLYGDTVIWTTSNVDFTTMFHDSNYKYMGTIMRGYSTGPNIEPFKGKNL